jgi:hypothetical protein
MSIDLSRTVVENRNVVRQIVAGLLAVTVQASAVTAPMLHVHLDDHDSDHHHAREMHSHLSGHGHHAGTLPVPMQPTLSDDDGDENVVAVSGFVATTVETFPGTVAIPVETIVITLADVTINRIPHVAHGHDPPAILSTPSRAPPSSLSC